MSAFNIVSIQEKCIKCGAEFLQRVQFKFGTVFQREYEIGAMLDWAPRAIGSPYGRFVVDGVGELSCPLCGQIGSDYYIFVSDGRVETVVLATGQYSFVDCGKSWMEI